MTRSFLLCAALALAACQTAPVPAAPGRADLGAELVRRDAPGPPPGPEGACWARDVTPALVQTVTEQREVAPASFRTVTRQRIVREREDVWFRVPCPDLLTAEFIASLQRALKARGLYLLPLTGRMDGPTREAIRRFQRPLGLDSAELSLAAARDLGLIAVDRARL